MSDSATARSIFGISWFLCGAGVSWLINKSIGWAILHGMFAGLYFLYLYAGFGGGFEAADSELKKLMSDNETHQEAE